MAKSTEKRAKTKQNKKTVALFSSANKFFEKMEYVIVNNINFQTTLKLMANILQSNYVHLSIQKITQALTIFTDHSECSKYSNSFNPHNNLMS